MPKRSNSHLVAASAPGYSVEMRQLRKSSTPPVTGSISGVLVTMFMLPLDAID